MNEIKLNLIEKLIEWLISEDSYRVIKEAVKAMMNSDMSGAEKRIAVQGLVTPILTTIAGILINLAIEVAVNSLKTQANTIKNDA